MITADYCRPCHCQLLASHCHYPFRPKLSPPIVSLGDFNAHSNEWGCSKNDSKGKMISDLMLQCNLSHFNDGCPTYLHPGTGSQSAIDLSICDPSLYFDFSWKVHGDLCGSDHFSIVIRSDTIVP